MKTTTRLVVLIALLMNIGRLSAQQDPLYTNYQWNALSINPAYAGSDGHFTALALTRQQWAGFDGAPSTHTLTGHGLLKSRKIGLGGTVVNDAIGPVSQLGIHADFAYILKLDYNSTLSLGVKAGGRLMQADWNAVSTNTAADDAFTGAAQSAFLPNFGFGAYLQNPKYWVALALPRLIRNDLTGGEKPDENVGEIRHAFFSAGYIYKKNQDLEWHPSFMLRKVANAPLSADINLNALIKQKLRAGVMYRVGGALGGNVQYQINEQFRIGYAYDLTTSAIGEYNPGTHEVLLRFDLIRKPKEESEPQEPSEGTIREGGN